MDLTLTVPIALCNGLLAFTVVVSTRSELGTRLDFVRSLGSMQCLAAGPNGVSCVGVASDNDAICLKEISELHATEIDIYRCCPLPADCFL